MEKKAVDLSADLVEWLQLNGWTISQGSQTDDGRTLIWKDGGAIRYYINFTDGWYVLTSSDRMGPESHHLATVSMSVLEKHLYLYMGGSIRNKRGFPHLRAPLETDSVPDGYRIGQTMFSGQEWDTLLDASGTVVVIGSDHRLIWLSQYIDAPADIIRRSLLDPEGKPLFVIWPDRR